jgi:hypothetical protein
MMKFLQATWHPLRDLAVVGRYPDPNFTGYHENELRTIDIIDVDTEKVVTRLHDPSASGLVCVSFKLKFHHSISCGSKKDFASSGVKPFWIWTSSYNIKKGVKL